MLVDSVDEFDEEDEFSDEESYEGSDDCDVDRPPLRGQVSPSYPIHTLEC